MVEEPAGWRFLEFDGQGGRSWNIIQSVENPGEKKSGGDESQSADLMSAPAYNVLVDRGRVEEGTAAAYASHRWPRCTAGRGDDVFERCTKIGRAHV